MLSPLRQAEEGSPESAAAFAFAATILRSSSSTARPSAIDEMTSSSMELRARSSAVRSATVCSRRAFASASMRRLRSASLRARISAVTLRATPRKPAKRPSASNTGFPLRAIQSASPFGAAISLITSLKGRRCSSVSRYRRSSSKEAPLRSAPSCDPISALWSMPVLSRARPEMKVYRNRASVSHTQSEALSA